MEEKDIKQISMENETEKKDVPVEKPKVKNFLSDEWVDEWDNHHGDIF
jgi:hypothetical protein